MSFRRFVVVGAVTTLLLANGLPATAHEAPSPVPEPAVADATIDRVEALAPSTSITPTVYESSAVPAALIAALAALLVLRRFRSRRAVAFAIALLLCLVAFEGAVHSVHHFDEPEARAGCAIAVAAGHVAGVDVAMPTVTYIRPRSFERVVLEAPLHPAVEPTTAPHGRAPPFSA